MNTRDALREIEKLGGKSRDAGGTIEVSHPDYDKRIRVSKSRKDAPRVLTVMLKRLRSLSYQAPSRAPSKEAPDPLPWSEGSDHKHRELPAMSLIDVDTQEKRVVLIERTCTVKIDRAGLLGLVRREVATELKRAFAVELRNLSSLESVTVQSDQTFDLTLSWVESEEHEGGTT